MRNLEINVDLPIPTTSLLAKAKILLHMHSVIDQAIKNLNDDFNYTIMSEWDRTAISAILAFSFFIIFLKMAESLLHNLLDQPDIQMYRLRLRPRR